MAVIYDKECDFCGQVKPIVCTTHGCYCEDCFKLIIDECEDALREFDLDIDKITRWSHNGE